MVTRLTFAGCKAFSAKVTAKAKKKKGPGLSAGALFQIR